MTIKVHTPSKEYPVIIGSGIFLNEINKILNRYRENFFFIIDAKVNKLYEELLSALKTKFPNSDFFVYTAFEKNKNYENLQKIHGRLIQKGYGRDTVIISIGGGITGDISGFAAASFCRGVKYIQVPTTLLAAVDSSVGGKTGINFNETKNIIGAFHQPEAVLIDTVFFNSLPKREIICGTGELVKYAFLAGGDYLDYFSENINEIINLKSKVINRLTAESVKFKAGVVEADEKEAGLRKILNLGHTFGHAFEVEQEHKIKHGEAVILGVICALYLSAYRGLIDINGLANYLRIFEELKNYVRIKTCDTGKIYSIMQKDKKSVSGKIKFILLTSPGNIVTDIEADKEEVIKSINSALLFTKGKN